MTKKPDRAIWIHEAIMQYERPLLRFAARMLDEDLARDVVQDAFIKLCDQSPEAIREPRAWLYRVVRHRAIDLIRKDNNMQTLKRDRQLARDETHEASDPARHAELADSKQQMLAAVDELPERQREAIRLKFIDGLSYREIGEILDISPSHVGVVLFQAMNQLRSQLTA